MTIIPQPLIKPLRRFEIIVGLLCVAVGIWMLAQVTLWLLGSEPSLEIRSGWGGVLVLVQSMYLLGFGGKLLRSGYVGLVFWVIAAAILVALPAAAGLFA